MKNESTMLDKKSNNKIIFVIILLVVIIAALAGAITYLVINRNGKTEDNTVKRNIVVNEQNVDKVIADMSKDEFTPVGSYEVTMNSTWNFKNGKAVSDNAYVKNAITNTNSVYFDVVRSDTGDTILESPILPVGSYLDKIALDKELVAGTYPCVCTYHLIDENNKPISEVSLKLTIIIGN
ncbi:MAG: hypothetical protein PUD13_07945 [Lachnospira sp.]|nr:hypothetical protein [Lachnospira sp.]